MVARAIFIVAALSVLGLIGAAAQDRQTRRVVAEGIDLATAARLPTPTPVSRYVYDVRQVGDGLVIEYRDLEGYDGTATLLILKRARGWVCDEESELTTLYPRHIPVECRQVEIGLLGS